MRSLRSVGYDSSYEMKKDAEENYSEAVWFILNYSKPKIFLLGDDITTIRESLVKLSAFLAWAKDGKNEKTFDALEFLAIMCSNFINKGEQMVCDYAQEEKVKK